MNVAIGAGPLSGSLHRSPVRLGRAGCSLQLGIRCNPRAAFCADQPVIETLNFNIIRHVVEVQQCFVVAVDA